MNLAMPTASAQPTLTPPASMQANVAYEQWWATTASSGNAALPLFAWACKALKPLFYLKSGVCSSGLA